MARGYYEALSSQLVDVGNAAHFMDTALTLAQTTVSSTKASVDALTTVMNSFRMNESQASEVSAVLFNSVRLGKVHLEEMGSALSKVSTISQLLGVDYKDQMAALDVLTQKGLKFNVASTMLSNILLKLEKPTEEMTNKFNQWGVTSGRAAIETLGLIGVLRRLSEDAEKTGDASKDLVADFKEFRAVIGGTSLIQSLDTFEKVRDEIKNTAEQARVANKDITDNLGKKMQIELEKFKNYFTIEWGNSIIKILADLTKTFGGLVPATKFVLTQILALGGAFVSYKAIMFAVNSVTNAFNVAQQRTIAVNALMKDGLTQVAAEARVAQAAFSSWATLGLSVAVFAMAELIGSTKSLSERIQQICCRHSSNKQ